jgi:hypothetical protein
VSLFTAKVTDVILLSSLGINVVDLRLMRSDPRGPSPSASGHALVQDEGHHAQPQHLRHRLRRRLPHLQRFHAEALSLDLAHHFHFDLHLTERKTAIHNTFAPHINSEKLCYNRNISDHLAFDQLMFGATKPLILSVES